MQVVLDNNIIDMLLICDDGVSNYLNNNFTLKTHSKIFYETEACNNEAKKEQLLKMYPKFNIVNINDNSYPLQYPFSYFSEEAWNMQKEFMKNKKSTPNNYNDSLLILLQYDNQLIGVDSILISQNSKDFTNFCKTNSIHYKSWDVFYTEFILINIQ